MYFYKGVFDFAELMGISIWIIFVKQRKDLKKETF
jgi:hypothetical protein